jgi:ferredoxin-type protein NapH
VLVLLLLATPAFGWSFFEGNLGAAAIVGLQLSDPLAALQILVLTGSLTYTMLIGTAIVVVFYWLFGGRAFCGWVCPVHLLTDLVDMLPQPKFLPSWSLNWKITALAVTVIVSILLGIPAFETVSPIGIAVRALTFGASSSLVALILIVIAEFFLVRRVWCRSLCPLGGFYALLGRLSPLAVSYDTVKCTHDCQQVCFVPEVLTPSLNEQVNMVHSGECTRCGACVGTCPDHALNFGIRKPF